MTGQLTVTRARRGRRPRAAPARQHRRARRRRRAPRPSRDAPGRVMDRRAGERTRSRLTARRTMCTSPASTRTVPDAHRTSSAPSSSMPSATPLTAPAADVAVTSLPMPAACSIHSRRTRSRAPASSSASRSASSGRTAASRRDGVGGEATSSWRLIPATASGNESTRRFTPMPMTTAVPAPPATGSTSQRIPASLRPPARMSLGHFNSVSGPGGCLDRRPQRQAGGDRDQPKTRVAHPDQDRGEQRRARGRRPGTLLTASARTLGLGHAAEPGGGPRPRGGTHHVLGAGGDVERLQTEAGERETAGARERVLLGAFLDHIPLPMSMLDVLRRGASIPIGTRAADGLSIFIVVQAK